MIKLAALGALGYLGYKYYQKNSSKAASRVTSARSADSDLVAGGPLSSHTTLVHSADALPA